jgi:FkbM family methyltransferase
LEARSCCPALGGGAEGPAMRPSLPVRLIASMPVGRRLLLRLWNRILMHFAPRREARTYFGAILDCDVRDMIQATIIHFGAWEPRISKQLSAIVREGDVIVDVGANIGYYSLLFSKLAGPGGQVVAVEALPMLAEVIHHHAQRNAAANVRVVNAAAVESPRNVAIYEAPATNIGMSTTREDRGFVQAAIVRGLPITDMLSEDELARVSLIKIDIEGGEAPVIRHLLDNIGRFPRSPAIAVEASVAEVPEWAELFERFLELGYRAYDLHNDYDWLALMDGDERPPTLLDRLPEAQTDILFTRQAI